MNTTNTQGSFTQTNSIEALESEYLYVRPSQIPHAGDGLYTAIDIYKDEVISLFKGEILTQQEVKERVQQKNDRYFINLLDGRIMDSMHTDCYAKYANDASGSSGSNFKNNAEITLDDDNHVCIKASKNIKSGDEVFCSYGKPYWIKHS